jgi:hypothetical protein
VAVQSISSAVNTAVNTAITGEGDPPSGGASPADQVVARMSALSGAEETAVRAFVDGCVADNNWQYIDEFYCFALNATDWLTGFRAYTATVPGGGVARTANGAESAGGGTITGFILTNTPLSGLLRYKSTSASMGLYVHTLATWGTGNIDLMGVEMNDNTRTRLRHRGSDTNDFRASVNSNTQITYSAAATSLAGKLYALVCQGLTVTDTNLYIDGVAQSPSLGGEGAPASLSPAIFGCNDEASPGTMQQSTRPAIATSWFVGSAAINQAALHARIAALQTSLGVT